MAVANADVQYTSGLVKSLQNNLKSESDKYKELIKEWESKHNTLATAVKRFEDEKRAEIEKTLLNESMVRE